jgi:hypothetical protein
VCDLHPEFGYVVSASVRRKLGLVLAFLVFGLVAGASGLAVFMADLDRDPKHAMALAPAEALIETKSTILTGTAETEVLHATLTEKTSKAAETKSPCREDIWDSSVGDCPSGKTRKPRSTLALNERPAIAAVPIGRRVDPAVLPPEPAAPVDAAVPEDAVTATPSETPSAVPASPASLPESAVTASPSDAGSTPPASLPAVAPTKAREHHRERVQRPQREHREYASTPRYHREQREYASTPRYYSSRQVYQSAGYARLW